MSFSSANPWYHDELYSTPTTDHSISSPGEECTLPDAFETMSSTERGIARSISNSRRKGHNCPFNLSTCTGCQSASPERYREQSREDSPYHVGSPTSLQSEDRAQRTEAWLSDETRDRQELRQRLVDQFLKLHFPAADHDADFMFTQFLSREVLQAAGPAMQEAVDTLCLAEIGTAYSDRDLIFEARKRYQACVANLLLDAEHSETAKDDDSILGAIYILEFCGFYPALHAGSGDRKALHQAMEKLLLARGSNASFSKLVQLLLYNVRHLDVIYGLVERKRSNRFRGKVWKQHIALTDSLMTEFTENNLRIPFFLEKCDILLGQEEPPEDQVVRLMIELSNLESRYQNWLLRYYSGFNGLPYWKVAIDTYPDFHLISADAPEEFTKALAFPSFSQCSAQITYWIAVINIKTMLLDLGQLLPFPAPLDRRQMLEEEGEELAERLCESVAWITQRQYGSCGSLRAMGPLFHARAWYFKQDNPERVAWCREVFKRVQTRGVAAGYGTLGHQEF